MSLYREFGIPLQCEVVYYTSSVGMGKGTGMAWREREGMKTLYTFPFRPLSKLVGIYVVLILLEERPVLEKSDPI